MSADFKQRSLFSRNEKIDLFFYERGLLSQGFARIAGIDEAGRGPLAGPVVAAAVILPPDVEIPGINDSKKLTEKKREHYYEEIRNKALAFGTGMAEPEEIDSINILQASLRSMERAVNNLSEHPDFLLIDGINTINISVQQKAVKKGDSLSISIAAASIIAKVTRDHIMKAYHKKYPLYDFASHKGYGSKSHKGALATFGPSPIHRKSFAGVKEHLR